MLSLPLTTGLTLPLTTGLDGSTELPPWDPASITGLTYWAAFSALALNDGDTVTTVPDSSGNGRTATRVSGDQTFVADGINGNGAIHWSSGKMETSAFQQWPAKAGTWAMAAMHMADAPESMVFGQYSQTGFGTDWLWYGNTTQGGNTKFFMTGAFPTGISWADLANVSNVQIWRRNGATLEFWINGYKALSYALGGNNGQTGSAKLYLGDGGINRSSNIRVTDIIGYDHAVTDDEILAITAGLCRKLYGGDPRLIVCDGDSITAGVGATSARNAYPTLMRSQISGRYYHLNTGVGGYTIPVLIANAATRYALAAAYPYDSYFVGWAGSNDLKSNDSAATILANNTTWFNGMRANGFKKLIACSINPRGDLSGGQETVRLQYNALLEGGAWQAFADGFANTAANPLMQNPANTTYYDPDTIHPTDAGHAQNAAIIAAAVNAL